MTRRIITNAFNIFTVFVVAIFPIIFPHQVKSAAMSNQSVVIGTAEPSAATTHNYTFTLASAGNVGSIEFEYCINSPFVGQPCTFPTGFSASAAVLDNQNGETGFSISGISTSNRLVLTRTSASSSAIPVSYSFSNIVNPEAPISTVYVRIATYSTEDATGPTLDEGAVAFASNENVIVEGYVPPFLTFCVGVTVAPNCTAFSGRLLDFGELRFNAARYVASQFAVSTNDPGGYSTMVTGPTMTSGNNTIDAITAPRPSLPGTSQFGMNLRSNSSPPIGADPVGAGTGTVSTGFNQPNRFFYDNQVVVQSPVPSDFNTFTVSYLVNVPRGQKPGIYSTTLTYIASAAF
jgi:hypothetical protein